MQRDIVSHRLLERMAMENEKGEGPGAEMCQFTAPAVCVCVCRKIRGSLGILLPRMKVHHNSRAEDAMRPLFHGAALIRKWWLRTQRNYG